MLQFHMGNCAEDTAVKYEVSRAEQDEFAVQSYTLSAPGVGGRGHGSRSGACFRSEEEGSNRM